MKLKRILSSFCREIRIIETPISKEGIRYKKIKSMGYKGHYSAKEFLNKKRPKFFTPFTAIINNGYAEWELEIPKHILKNLIDATLKIETIRTHGMLHSFIKNKKASIYVNDYLVDEINLVRKHSHGEDYGVDTRRPIPIYQFINKKEEKQTVRIKTEKYTFWDIDRITIEPITKLRELKPIIFMVLGAIISGIVGGIISIIFFIY